MSFCLRPNVCKKCGKPLTMFEGWTCLECEKAEQEPCDDAISRILKRMWNCRGKHTTSIDKVAMEQIIRDELPSVTQKSGKCKNCKYFEYDSMAKVDGVPLIVAHEICNKWGDGCKTNEDGYCFLFEPQESEVRNEVNYRKNLL